MNIAEQARMVAAGKMLSIKEFSEICGLSEPLMGQIFREQISVTRKSEDKIVEGASKIGYKLTEDSIVKTDKKRIELKGDSRFLDLLNDIDAQINGDGELWIDGAVEHKTPDFIMDRVLELRDKGMRMRNLIREGDRKLKWPLNEYRWLPTSDFVNQVIFIYPNSIAIDDAEEETITIHRDRMLHLSQKKKFERDWRTFEQPDYSELHNE